MKRRIAIVEDDPDQSANVQAALVRHGYRAEVYGDVPAALAGMARSVPDLVILDIMLGSDSDGGFMICRELLARQADLPVIFLSSRRDEIDRISGLRLGAWDYQTKPVSLPFLVERIASLFRIVGLRQHRAADTERLELGPLMLDETRMTAQWQGQLLSLTLTEYRILAEIVAARGRRGASYDELAASTRQGIVENNTINTHVRHLRRKFQAIDPAFDAIRNVYGFGYRWGEP